MPKTQESHRVGPDGKRWERKVVKLTISVYDKDVELLAWLEDYFGSGSSDVIRTAIRSLAAQMAQIPAPKTGATTD